MQHELEVAGAAGALGSIDANTGDELLGWDTDQFPTNIYLTTQIMLTILKYGGFTTGGMNFDAKVRRESFEPVDLFYAHIGGMDAFARGLEDRRRHSQGRTAGGVREAALRLVGLRHRREDRSGQGRLQGTGSLHAQEGRSRRRTPAAARNSWKTSSTNSSEPAWFCRAGCRGPDWFDSIYEFPDRAPATGTGLKNNRPADFDRFDYQTGGNSLPAVQGRSFSTIFNPARKNPSA